MKLVSLFLFLFLSGGLVVAEDLRLHPLFTPHAVLQQELPAPVWGWALPESEVTVSFAGETVTTKTDRSGKWIVIFENLKASFDPKKLTVQSGEETLTIPDILVGEVWIGSGQSNMAMTVDRSLEKSKIAEQAAAGKFNGVRLFKVPVEGSDARSETVEAEWALASESSIQRFSATAFFFAAKLSEDRSVPVGIIQSANGGTNAYSWINGETVASDPAAESVRSFWASAVQKHPAAMERYKQALARFREKKAAAKKAGKTFEGRAPREPVGPTHVKRPAGHYHAMIAPLQPYGIRGVIWYQGEANSRVPFSEGYRDLMLALVEDWRADWARASSGQVARREFPFYLVQLPNYARGSEEGWPVIREQMLRFWQEGENTGMVVAIDKGEAEDIHPRDKKPVGERLALFARANAYGEEIVYSGPIFEKVSFEGEKARISFSHRGSGLTSLDGEPLAEFEIAAAGGAWSSAEAKIEGDEVVVSSADVKTPRAVRYAWSPNPEKANLGNGEGLPASPFRSNPPSE